MSYEHEAPPVKDAETPRPEQRGLSALYEVRETASGAFEAILPGLTDFNGRIIGTATEGFFDRESAERAAADSQIDMQAQADIQKGAGDWMQKRTLMREYYDQKELAATYTVNCSIEKKPDGTYAVVYPQLVDLESGELVIGSSRCATWEEARHCYIDQRAHYEEQLSHSPLLRFKPDPNTTVSFVDFNGYDPQPSPTDQEYPISKELGDKFYTSDNAYAHSQIGGVRGEYERELTRVATHSETMKREGWERELYRFVQGYLLQEEPELARQIGITNLRELSPRQAAELSTSLIVKLRKYYADYKSERVKRDEKGEITERYAPTSADTSSTIELLEEGLINRSDPDWKGNGVCRNFAAAVLDVFNALKASQKELNQLRNTHCIYSSGHDYAPGKENLDTSHAWNSFLTVTKDGSGEVTVVDATWAKENLKTGEMYDLDYTPTRMEPIVQAYEDQLRRNPDPEAIHAIMAYYAQRIESASRKDAGGHSTVEAQQAVFARNVLDFILTTGTTQNLPPTLIPYLAAEIPNTTKRIFTSSKTGTLFSLQKEYPELGIDMRAVFDSLYRKDDLGEISLSCVTFDDDELQILALDHLKRFPNLYQQAQQNKRFQERMKQLTPGLE